MQIGRCVSIARRCRWDMRACIRAFCCHAEAAAARYGLDTREILVELGRRRMVGGQEDMIVDVALDLARMRSTLSLMNRSITRIALFAILCRGPGACLARGSAPTPDSTSAQAQVAGRCGCSQISR